MYTIQENRPLNPVTFIVHRASREIGRREAASCFLIRGTPGNSLTSHVLVITAKREIERR